MNIYYLGNKLLEQDSITFKIIPELKQKFPEIRFIEFDPTENFPEEETFIFLDAAVGITKAAVIEDISRLKTRKRYSLHDFDLAFNLKLLKKMGGIKKAMIIGIPAEYAKSLALKEVSEILKKFI